MNDSYHIPVLLKESIDGLNIKENGIYVDVTFGGGGHSREILKRLTSGKLIVFDQDADAFENCPKDDRIIFVRHNFKYIKHFLNYINISKVDGILADLGVSSHHFDTPERGFSIRFDGELDMRMNQNAKVNAADILNSYDEDDLFGIFKNYGEIKHAGKLVKGILNYRNVQAFKMISDLLDIVKKCVPANNYNKYAAKVFQALRIEVNGELDALKELLKQSVDLLNPKGRLSIISYHSLEDRLVKNFFKTGDVEKNEVEKDFYGNIKTPFKIITRKPILANEQELKINSRARSAKLRIAEKITEDA